MKNLIRQMHVLTLSAIFLCLVNLSACLDMDLGITPLHGAAAQGDTKRVLVLMDGGWNVDVQDSAHQTPLHYAAGNGNVDTVRALLDRGAKVNATAYRGATPLFYAANAGKLDVVQLLVERGADVTVKAGFLNKEKAPQSPAQVAESQGYSDVAQYLREAEARAAQGKALAPAAATSAPSSAAPAKPTESPPPPIY